MFEYEYVVSFGDGDGIVVFLTEYVKGGRAGDEINLRSDAVAQATQRLRDRGYDGIALWPVVDVRCTAVRGGVQV